MQYHSIMRTIPALLTVWCLASLCALPPALAAAEPPPAAAAAPTLSAAERAAIDAAIRRSLKLPAEATIGPVELGRVTVLMLRGEPITDAGAAWLADPATGLGALTELHLGGTRLTNVGAAALAARG